MILSLQIKKGLSLFFLLAFIFIKVGGLHSLAHSDEAKETQDCVWCHLSGTDKHTPIIAIEESYEILPAQDFGQHQLQDNHYRSIASSKTPVCLIFNKPPPFYTL